MKVQIDSASNLDGDVTHDYGEKLKKAGFQLQAEKGKFFRRSFIDNFDFSRVPDLMSAVGKDVIIATNPLHKEENDVICITIYDGYVE
ncbi:hypothetical protein MUDAN_BIHEEGNE_00669 [Lactiplantibacillus mudanjiangensis]|uniref:hypothetical protein n=1 Tax=Lactiplantibacillus mudanjiangensis TaxID=1296538 RepID=UPI001013E44B|nr:hypothetical protein MUDAN_BIHEEGNE_00669 [Lactiplantibacillus mudanjiangensis]